MCTRTCAVLFLFLKLQTCYGNYDCFQLSSGKDICFMFEDTLRTFEESKLLCQNNGGFLVEIYDSEMQGFVEQFVKSKTVYLKDAWLNLIRIDPNTWVWGGQPGNKLNYSNWETSNPASYGINVAFMNSNYKWRNNYDPQQVSTICIQGSRELYLSETSTSRTTTEIELLDQPLTIKKTATSSTFASTSSSEIRTFQLESAPALIGRGISIGIGVGVALGVLIIVIVSSLLVAKFVFHKEIPFPCKSAGSRLSEPSHQSGSDVIKEVYESVDEIKMNGMNFMKSAPTYENVLHEDNTSTCHYASLSQPETDSNYYEALRNRGEI